MIQVNKLKTFEEVKDYYYIDLDGNVYSVYGGKVKELKGANRRGYKKVDLQKKDGVSSNVAIHRLVAMAAFEDEYSEECNQVDHLDGDKSNNHYMNLQWVSASENMKRTARSKGMGQYNGRIPTKAVERFDLETDETLAIYASTGEATRDGYTQPSICACCKGILKSHKGFGWRYVNA